MKNKLEFMRLYNLVSTSLSDKSTISFCDYVFYEQVVIQLGSQPLTSITDALIAAKKDDIENAFMLIRTIAIHEGIE